MKLIIFVPIIIFAMVVAYLEEGWEIALLFAASGILFYLAIIFEALVHISEQIEKKLK